MGQLFTACAYDIKTKTSCVLCVDKFHANCYSFSGGVLSMHYLLRQKPWRIMWGGNYVAGNKNLAKFSRNEDLQGISAYLDYEYFERKDYDCHIMEKVKLIGDYRHQWKQIDVWDEAENYFDKSVKYKGYLVNHTKKMAIDLADYHRQSKSMSNTGVYYAIDLIPVLTETGDGTPMALYEGISTDTTEELAGTWCGDELQIVDELPDDYKLINCCFAEVWNRANYCNINFGVSDDGYLLKDDSKNLYEAVKLNIVGKRGEARNLKVEKIEKKIRYIPELIPKGMSIQDVSEATDLTTKKYSKSQK